MGKLSYIIALTICSVSIAQTRSYNKFILGEVSPNMYGRTNLPEFYASCETLENMFVWALGPIEKRRGTYFIAEVGGEIFPEIPATPVIPQTYTMTTISENTKLWSIPLSDASFLSMDAAPAVDVGGGVVGLPMTGHPYSSGDTIIVSNTTNYNSTFTLLAGTSTNELQVTSAFVAETFNGNEPVVKTVTGLESGYGHMAGDSNNNIYYGHVLNTDDDPDNYYVTRIAPDNTITVGYNFLNYNFPPNAGADCLGINVTDDILYIWTQNPLGTPVGNMYKFNLSTEELIWVSDNVNFPGFEIDVDSSGNAYAPTSGGIVKFDSADGADTLWDDVVTPSGSPLYEIDVNDLWGIGIVTGFDTSLFDVDLFNLWVFNLSDGTVRAETTVGGKFFNDPLYQNAIIGVSFAQIKGNFIYVLAYPPATNTATLYKYDIDLNLQTSVAGPTDSQGLYFDLWGNLVVVNQDLDVGQTNVFHYYDTDLTSLAVLDGFNNSMFAGWDAAVGGVIHGGDEHFDGILSTPGTPAVPAVTTPTDQAEIPARLLSFEQDFVVEVGHKYMRFFKGG